MNSAPLSQVLVMLQRSGVYCTLFWAAELTSCFQGRQGKPEQSLLGCDRAQEKDCPGEAVRVTLCMVCQFFGRTLADDRRIADVTL